MSEVPPPVDAARSYPDLTEQLQTILADTLLSASFVGVKVTSIEDGSTLFELNGNKLFHPASTLKLFTTAASLHYLNPEFKFTTILGADSVDPSGVVRGNLYVVGRGDPLLTTADFDSLASSLRRIGIRQVRGDLVGDISYFDTVSWGAGWMWDDEPEPEEAFISPLTINNNSVDVLLRLSRRQGQRPEAVLNPPTAFFSILNEAVESADTVIPPVTVTRIRGQNTLRVYGRYDRNTANAGFRFSVHRPELYFLGLLRESLLRQGIPVHGATRIDSARLRSILFSRSHPLDSVVFRINKESDNLAAENLLKTLSAELSRVPGSAVDGIRLVKEYIGGLAIDTAAMRIVDGSGVSWYNAVSPSAIVQLLHAQYLDNRTFSRFYASLPIAGIDGTLKGRMRGTRAMANVRAKTGTLTGTSSIAGYVTTLDGKPLALSILCNHFPGKAKVLRDIQDRILNVLASTSLTTP